MAVCARAYDVISFSRLVRITWISGHARGNMDLWSLEEGNLFYAAVCEAVFYGQRKGFYAHAMQAIAMAKDIFTYSQFQLCNIHKVLFLIVSR